MNGRFQRYAWIASRVDWQEVAQIGIRYWERYDRAVRSGRQGRARLVREILLDLADWVYRR